MERVLSHVLLIFSAGFALIGLVVGLIKSNTGDFCGAVLSHDGGCAQPSSMIAMVVVLWGLSATCLAAATIAGSAAPPPRREPDKPLDVYTPRPQD